MGRHIQITVLLLLTVFLLLSCMLFLIFLVVRAASTTIALETLCSRPLQEKKPHRLHLFSYGLACIFKTLSFICLLTVFLPWHALLRQRLWLLGHYTASGLRLVPTKLGKTNLIYYRLQVCPLSSTALRLVALVSSVASPCLTNCICSCFCSFGRFLLSTSSTSTNTRRTHVTIFIYPELALLASR